MPGTNTPAYFDSLAMPKEKKFYNIEAELVDERSQVNVTTFLGRIVHDKERKARI
jgi:hypothetical protein